VLFVACECCDVDCVETVAIEPTAYVEARSRADTFVVAREHAGDGEGAVLVEDPGYLVVVADAMSDDAAPRTGADEFADRHFRALVAQLRDRLPEDGRKDALRSADEAFGRRLAAEAKIRPERDVAADLQRVCDAVSSLGFHASLGEVGKDVAVIAGMWIGLVDEAVSSVEADDLGCETHACLERGEPCLVTIRFAAR
jgi:hypothetical protein